jgi:23S rRNA (uracil1939-C5)-methyltransferase
MAIRPRMARVVNPAAHLCRWHQDFGFPDDWLHINSLDLEAQGVARKTDGKVVFVDGALPFEWVTAQVNRKKEQLGGCYPDGHAPRIVTARHTGLPALWLARRGVWRLQDAAPGCHRAGGHETTCAGRQPVAPGQSQARYVVAAHTGPHMGLPLPGPAVGAPCHQKRRGADRVSTSARAATWPTCRYAPCCRPMSAPCCCHCAALIAGMDARDTCPQIELACGDDVTALVLRHLDPLSAKPTKTACAAFVSGPPQRAMVVATQRPRHGSTARPPRHRTVCHRWSWRMSCQTLASACPSSRPTSPRSTPTSTACWSAVHCDCWMRRSHERVIDWFCGLGNFTLPIATQAGQRSAGH